MCALKTCAKHLACQRGDDHTVPLWGCVRRAACIHRQRDGNSLFLRALSPRSRARTHHGSVVPHAGVPSGRADASAFCLVLPSRPDQGVPEPDPESGGRVGHCHAIGCFLRICLCTCQGLGSLVGMMGMVRGHPERPAKAREPTLGSFSRAGGEVGEGQGHLPPSGIAVCVNAPFALMLPQSASS